MNRHGTVSIRIVLQVLAHSRMLQLLALGTFPFDAAAHRSLSCLMRFNGKGFRGILP